MNTIFIAELWKEFLLPSAVSLAVFYLLYKLIVRNDTHLRSRRFLILGFLIFAVVLPFLSFQLPIKIAASPSPVFYQDIISVSQEATPVLTNVKPTVAVESHKTISVWEIIGWIYAAVVLVLSIRFIVGILRLTIFTKRGKQVQTKDTTIILSPNFTTAFSFFHKIFMPESWYDGDECNLVLKHERVHVKQKHSWDLILMELVCIVQFFNPFAWMLKHEMRLNHEFLADRGALESSNSTEHYFQLLLQKIIGKQPILVNSFNYSPIKHRIIMTTLKKPAKILSSARYFAFVLVALSLTILFACKRGTTTSETSASNSTKFLFLNAEQLKPLGVELSEKGLFYLNKNPKENEYSHFIAFHAGENNKACEPQDIHFNPKAIENDPIFKDKNVTNNEIYIKQITNPQGSFQYAYHTISGKENENPDCIPIAICMSETKIKSRTDTIVFWFYPTKALQQALPKGVKMTDYLITPEPYSVKDEAKEFYKSLSGNVEVWKMVVTDLGNGEGNGDFPKYPEGGEAFYKYLTENIKYPEALSSKNFKGDIATVVVEFHVEKDGSISRIEPFCYVNADNKTINLDKDSELIINSCNEEAVRVVENMPKWIPSKDYEYMSQFRVTLPIIFSLTD